MAILTRTSVLAIKEEATEGQLVQPASGSDFTPMREGFSFQGSVESLTTDELTGQRETSAPILGKETPSGSVSKYLKGSGVEGVEPDYAQFIKSCLGTQTTNATEYDLVAGSTAGTSAARASLNVNAGEGVAFRKGQAVLIKDLVNGYKIRNIQDIATDALKLNFNLNAAPAALVNLGKAIHFEPSIANPPTFSAHLYQGQSSSAYHNAIAGCRTVNMNFTLPAAGLGEVTFDFEGTKFFFNPIQITASTKYLDFTDSTGTVSAILTEKVYKTPVELAEEIASKMTGVSSDIISCSFDSKTGLFTISSDGTVLSLLTTSGTNVANTAYGKIGFSGADKTLALTYTSDTAQSYDAPYAPVFDVVDPIVIKNAELMIGDFFENFCRKAIDASFSASAPKQDANSVCAESGVGESLSLNLESVFTATIQLEKHEVAMFDKFINNKTTQVMFNAGVKDGANNWVPGKCVNICMMNAKISSDVISDSNGIAVLQIEARAFGTGTDKSFHINFV